MAASSLKVFLSEVCKDCKQQGGDAVKEKETKADSPSEKRQEKKEATEGQDTGEEAFWFEGSRCDGAESATKEVGG